MSLLRQGELFEGLYEIRAKLGEGGFAVVYDAVDVESGRRAAVKVLKPTVADGGYDPLTRARFQREARLVDGLKSAHSVTLLGSGETAAGLLFLVFEHVGGEDLSDIIARKGKLAPDEVGALLRQMLAALDEAHRAGLVHRDIKPENIRCVIGRQVRFFHRHRDVGMPEPFLQDVDRHAVHCSV